MRHSLFHMIRSHAALITRVALLFALVTVSAVGCGPMPTLGGLTPTTELAAAPFEVPNGVKLPPKAKIVMKQQAAKGGDGFVAIETSTGIPALHDFFINQFALSGLTLVDDTSRDDKVFSLLYKGWPGGKSFGVSCSDMAYRSDKDIRNCSVSLQSY